MYHEQGQTKAITISNRVDHFLSRAIVETSLDTDNCVMLLSGDLMDNLKRNPDEHTVIVTLEDCEGVTVVKTYKGVPVIDAGFNSIGRDNLALVSLVDAIKGGFVSEVKNV